jgi:hypothetical protein
MNYIDCYDIDEERAMRNLNLKIDQVSRTVEPLDLPVIDAQVNAQDDVNTTAHGRIPVTVRSRFKVLRVAPPIDDGFRPFRVF